MIEKNIIARLQRAFDAVKVTTDEPVEVMIRVGDEEYRIVNAVEPVEPTYTKEETR